MSGSERNLEGPPFVTGVSKTATQRPQGTKLQCVLFQGLVFTRGGVLLRPMGTRTDGFWVGGAQTSREKKRVRATYYQNETADGTSYKAWRERKRDQREKRALSSAAPGNTDAAGSLWNRSA